MLEIERGRHTRPVTPVENRRCPVCNVIENELHFYWNAPLIKLKDWNYLTKF